MRKTILIGLMLAVLVVPVCSSKAQVLKISTGAQVAIVLYQTSPPAFATYSQWGGISLSVLFGSITIDAAISVADLETLTISEHPTLCFTGKIKIAQLGPAALEVSSGICINPYYKWTTLDVGLGTTITFPIPFMELRSRISIGRTEGAPGLPAGTGVQIEVGVFVSVPLF